MEFRLSEQQEMIRQMAADFAANEIVPYCADWDHRREVPLGTLAKMQELGFMTIGVPLEYGGDGLDNTSQCLVCEEIAKGDAGMATTIVASTILASAPILVGANHEQKKWWYGRHLDGAVCGFCLTEPSAGSDALSISTRCIKDGDHYIINGTKQFITNGGIAMQFSVMAMGMSHRRSVFTIYLISAFFSGVAITLSFITNPKAMLVLGLLLLIIVLGADKVGLLTGESKEGAKLLSRGKPGKVEL
jgi:alkylation response protein AidB-like acyl-CoA dehydrogenase